MPIKFIAKEKPRAKDSSSQVSEADRRRGEFLSIKNQAENEFGLSAETAQWYAAMEVYGNELCQ